MNSATFEALSATSNMGRFYGWIPDELSENAISAEIGGTPGVTPLLRWAGSKKKLLPKLIQASPRKYTRYLEPFVGSAILFLQLDPRSALLSDINKNLIDTYKMVRDHPKRVWDMIRSWPSTESFYYHLRSLDTTGFDDCERAARFVYLNRYCFNGVYRTNRAGQFNVSRGKGNLGIPAWPVFEEFAKKLTNVDLQLGDFENTVSQAKLGDFIYLDPPYAELGKRDRGEYGPTAFKAFDVPRLLEAILGAADRGAKILLSYSASQIDLSQLPGWHVHELSVMRNVSGFVGNRKQANEVLISNYSWT